MRSRRPRDEDRAVSRHIDKFAGNDVGHTGSLKTIGELQEVEDKSRDFLLEGKMVDANEQPLISASNYPITMNTGGTA
jgi:hypothetical protein